MRARFEPAGPLGGELRPPPDKSISHRAALVGAMADGLTRVSRYLDSADTRSTLAAISAVGAKVAEVDRGEGGAMEIEIRGTGLRGPRPAEIDVGNAGTLLRIMPGWLAGQGEGKWSLDGDESIRRRPVDRVREPLSRMGAEIECREGRFPPLRVRGTRLEGITYELPVASAQVKSCVLLAGLLAEGPTTVREPIPTRDHTERMLAAAGAEIRRAGEEVAISPGRGLEVGDISVPGDFSSAAFPLVAALLVPGSEIVLHDVGLNKTRIGLLAILARMGVKMGGPGAREVAGSVRASSEPAVTVDGIGEAGSESIGTLRVRHSELRGAAVLREDVPSAIDELPLVALLGCFAEGRTSVRGAEELRGKESDRIAGVVDGLRALGAEIEALPDGFVVTGRGGLRGGAIDPRGDHRMAMLGAVAGLASREGVEVRGMQTAAISYPRFVSDLERLLRPGRRA